MNGSILLLLTALLLGSIPFGLIMGRIFGGKDVRLSGSGNIGATNVSRVLGFWPAGFLTFLLDALKGFLAVALSGHWTEGLFVNWVDFPEPSWALGSPLLSWTAAALVVAGHCYSPWLRFKGGKGVATGFGALLILSPWASLAGLLAFGTIFLATRVGSLSSLVGVLVLAITHLVLPSFFSGVHLVAGAVLIFIILLRHRDNLDALLENRESRF